MHETRTAILAGDIKRGQNPAPSPESCRRRKSAEATLVDVAIPREQRRVTNQRQENRFDGVVKRAIVIFRRRTSIVRVVNVSGGGVMIESRIMPRIGEAVWLKFEGFDKVEAIVRWVKKGRIGLDVGEGTINFD